MSSPSWSCWAWRWSISGLWFRGAYLIYAIAFLLLIAVEVRGAIGMGAQRWIDLGVIQLQPSEFMKIALVLALARYFHGIPRRGHRSSDAADPAGDRRAAAGGAGAEAARSGHRA